MNELRTFGWYAARVAPHLPKEAFQPVPSRLWGGLAYLVVAVSGIVAIGAFDLPVFVNIAISIVLGLCYGGIGLFAHEVLHGTVIRNRKWRDIVGAIGFWPLCVGPKIWRKWHNMEHHIHTQDEHDDPDAWATLEKLQKRPLLRKIYKLPMWLRTVISFTLLSLMFTFHALRMFKRYINEFKPKDRPVVWMQLILPWATWIGLLVWLGPAKGFFFYLIPLLIANAIVMGYISTNHRLNPLTTVNDPLANTLSVTVPKWVDVLHFQFSYHTEHHLFPGMNPKYFPMVKDKVKEMWPDRYFEMPLTTALAALWQTPRIYHNHTELIDPETGTVYGTLGHGLDPNNIEAEKLEDREATVPTYSKVKNH